MNPEQLADWAFNKACIEARAGNGCSHPACEEVLRAHELLKRIRKFEGMDSNGNPANGYIIEA